jgi:hypothetical protein
MIDALPDSEEAWLGAFFAPPNGLSWADIRSGAAPAHLLDGILPWLAALTPGSTGTAIVLPFIREGEVVGWYASRLGPDGGRELGDELIGWFGPTYLGPFRRLPTTAGDPMAAAMAQRFGGPVVRFAGRDRTAMRAMATRLEQFRALLARRPTISRTMVRPLGALRAEFDRAILVRDELEATRLLEALRATGRLNEENLRYLDVRVKAGLGYWPQIARDHWLLAMLSDLALPPQVLVDLIEALYRTYVEPLETGGDLSAMLEAFREHVAARYPRLFASRRGVRTRRVLKAFVLLERLQPTPDPVLLADLIRQLPEADRAAPWVQAAGSVAPRAKAVELQAEEAFDDGQFDRAFELFLATPASRKSIGRLLTCALTIGTPDARQRLAGFIEAANRSVVAELPEAVRQRIDALDVAAQEPPETAEGWLGWSRRLQHGVDLAASEVDVLANAPTWDVTPYSSEARSRELMDILSNLDGPAAEVVKRSLGSIFAAFFPEGDEVTPGTRPIAQAMLLLIAMDDALSAADLALLSQLTARLLSAGLSAHEYLGMVRDLAEVQGRMASYVHLSWSLDLCEALAIAPCPSVEGQEARTRLFSAVLGQCHAFAHRLDAGDLLVIEYLANDFGVDPAALTGLKRQSSEEPAGARLEGKTIGIYTLAESAGVRAKQALEAMFPGCTVELNSDLVCTERLTSLAKAADLFVFAWKSSSHQAFYCVKDSMRNSEPVWASGKGTASILRAVREATA